jgi:hypothetical protein
MTATSAGAEETNFIGWVLLAEVQDKITSQDISAILNDAYTCCLEQTAPRLLCVVRDETYLDIFR